MQHVPFAYSGNLWLRSLPGCRPPSSPRPPLRLRPLVAPRRAAIHPSLPGRRAPPPRRPAAPPPPPLTSGSRWSSRRARAATRPRRRPPPWPPAPPPPFRIPPASAAAHTCCCCPCPRPRPRRPGRPPPRRPGGVGEVGEEGAKVGWRRGMCGRRPARWGGRLWTSRARGRGAGLSACFVLNLCRCSPHLSLRRLRSSCAAPVKPHYSLLPGWPSLLPAPRHQTPTPEPLRTPAPHASSPKP